MADISLRTYIEEIDGLIDRKQVDEAVAHCRHILNLYPKHLDAYRMLGKALLEKGRHGDAADIFQRVLSVAPDDFIAHVGMSIVREDEANLEAALWHMERAFETNPSNAAIQEELRRLYGRRDGVTPPRARLTRGALARMYTLGELYHQAQAEIQAALAEDTDRVDLETTLAQVYFNSGQYTEAAQTCSGLIQKLPYSKEANRILGDILRAQGRDAEAAPYRKRLEALDPYEAFSDPASNGQGAAKVKSEAIRLPKLDYSPGLEDSGAPDWVASAGLKFDDSSSAATTDSGTPDWLTNSLTPTSEVPSDTELPDWLRDMQPSAPAAPSPEMAEAKPGNTDWLNALRAGVPESESAAPQPASEMPDWLKSATGAISAESMPDWMKEEVKPAEATPDWMNAPTAALTPPEPAEATPDWMNATTSALEPTTDLPDWMKSAAPVSAVARPSGAGTPRSDEEAAVVVSEAIEPATEIPPWMQDIAPLSEAAEPATEIPAWMQSAAPSATEPATEIPPWLQGAPAAAEPATDTPPWMQSAEPAAEIPAWMQGAAPASAATEPPAETPSWMQDTAAAAEPATEIPAWMQSAEPAAEIPAWMQSAAPVSEATEPATEIPPWMQSTAPASEAAEPATDIPPWMQSAEPATEIPAWMQGAAPVGEAAEPATDIPPWMQGAVPVSAATVSAATEPSAEIPPWMQSAAPVSAATEAEKPDWLKQMEAESDAYEASLGAPPAVAAVSEAAVVSAATEPTPASARRTLSPDELPDFLQIASPEALENANRPSEFADFANDLPVSDDVPAAEAADLPDWLKAMAPLEPEPTSSPPTMSEAEAAQWLASLQSAAPSTVEAIPPEAPAPAPMEAETMQSPEWLRPPVSAVAHPSGAGTPRSDEEATEAEAQPTSDLPDWIKAAGSASGASATDTVTGWLANKPVPDWMRQPGAEAAAPPPEWLRAPTEPEPPAAELPDWATEVGAATEAQPPIIEEAPVTPMPAAGDLASMSADDALRWLETLAAQQGANPEELITQPSASEAIPALSSATEAAQPDLDAMSADDALRWLETLAAQHTLSGPVGAGGAQGGARPEELISQPATEAPAPSMPEPVSEAAEPDFSSMSPDEAMRWLETLAAQHTLSGPVGAGGAQGGARPEELITQPEERSAEPPAWIASPASAATEAPESESFTPSVEPDFSTMDPDEAMRWLESLAAQQGANPEELITTPEERLSATTEPPEWIAAPPIAPISETPISAAAEAAVSEVAEPAISAEPDFSEMSPDDAMRWLESLAAQQGARPEELITQPEERLAEPPAWIAAQTVAPESAATEATPVSEATPPAPTDVSAMDEDDALRWLETLAAQQGASPDELVTKPEERVSEPPTWVTASQAAAPAEVTPPVSAAPETITGDVSKWLESLAPVPAPTPEPARVTPPVKDDKPEAGGTTKLSRLAEQLAAKRRAKDDDIAQRFQAQRAEKEAAMREVQEKMDQKKRPGTGQLTSRPGTGPMTRPGTGPVSRPGTGAITPWRQGESQEKAAEAAPRKRAAPSAARIARPKKARAGKSPYAAQAPQEVFALAQQRIAEGDFDNATEMLTYLIATNQMVDETMTELETFLHIQPDVVALWQVLGDAYMRNNRLQKALDAYRQALGHL